MDFGLALKRLEEFEREIEALYARFAETYQSEPSVADTFRGLSHEEHGHADIISYQFRMFQKNKLLFKDVEIDAAQIAELTRRVRDLRTTERSLTSDEALEAAYDIENSAAEHYYVLAGAASNPEIKGLLKAMASSCSEHHGRLSNF